MLNKGISNTRSESAPLCATVRTVVLVNLVANALTWLPVLFMEMLLLIEQVTGKLTES